MPAIQIEDQWFDCKDLLAWGEQIESKVLQDIEAELTEYKDAVITPGGRVGNDSPFSASRTDNWVARTGGLPKYVRMVARGIMKSGKVKESRAISMAIGVLKNWASGKGNVSAKVRAAAAAAIAQWEKMKGASHARSAARRASSAAKSANQPDITRGETMEHKSVEVKGFTVEDAEQGIVSAIVSVTGVVDNVKDNILPGAYEKTLVQRKPKGVWAHDWKTTVSKALEAKELMPGDADLPKTLANGQPWPKEAGGLKITAQFNMKTQRGREAFEDVVFYGDEQEWSIGYQVPLGGSTTDSKSGVREINTLNLYEFSPVLFGAMPLSMTTSVKDAQEAIRRVRAGESLDDLEAEYEAKMAGEEDIEEKGRPAKRKRTDQAVEQVEEDDSETDGDVEHDPEPKPASKPKRGSRVAADDQDDDGDNDSGDGEDDDEDEAPASRQRGTGRVGPRGKKSADAGETKARSAAQVDDQPYADPDSDYDDDEDTTPNGGMVQLPAAALARVADLVEALDDLLSGAGYDRGADDGDDMTAKGDDAFSWFESKAEEGGPLVSIVDQLSEFKDSIPTFNDLEDLADDYDEEKADGNDEDAQNTMRNFVDALKNAYEDTDMMGVQTVIEGAVKELSKLLEDDGIDPASVDKGGDSASSDDGSKDGEPDDSETKDVFAGFTLEDAFSID